MSGLPEFAAQQPAASEPRVRITGRDLVASPADLAACRASIRVGSKTFHAASLLLPRRVRSCALALYAFCREADDAIDRSDDPFHKYALPWQN